MLPRRSRKSKAGCFSCGSTEHLARNCPAQTLRCHSCGQPGHLARICPKYLAAGGARRCGEDGCFVRRFVVPLRRLPAEGNFDLVDLRNGRVDTACRLVSAAFFLSRAVRHAVEVTIPLSFGRVRTLQVTGGSVTDLRPDEQTIAAALQATLQTTTSAAVTAVSDSFAVANEINDGIHADAITTESSSANTLSGGFEAGAPVSSGRPGFAVSECGLSVVLDAWRRSPAAWTVAIELCEDGDFSLDEMVTLVVQRQQRFRSSGSGDAASVAGSEGCIAILLGDGEGVDEADAAAFRAWAAEAAGGVLRVRLGEVSLLGSHCVVLIHHFLDRVHTCPAKLWAAGH
eukprot:TRINITY_DN57352_c0_g1_i1.p1 TRINITY_DN57352_c0_g1~~TRINITY_DN57352_c0_g1_i1.p1  ORF type:complete len:343 (-),score=58.19 TRINITY_DN57352_c0_g1_i1:154-1182(-)